MQLVKPIPFTEAVEKIGAKTLIGADLSSSEWHDVPVALRERAFFSSRVESVRFLQRGRDAITDFLSGARETLPDGRTALKTGSRAEFVKQMNRFALANGLGPLDPKDKGTVKDITSERRLSLIFNVQTQQAHDFGAWKQGMDPDTLEAFPAQRFVRVVDVEAPRHAHTPFEDQVRLKSDLDFWLTVNADFGVPWGPWGWGCGHDVEDVDREEAESLGLLQPGQRPEPVEKDFNARLEASTKGLDADMLGLIRRGLGDNVEISGDSVRWVEKRSQRRTKQPAEPRQERKEAVPPKALTIPNLDDLAAEYRGSSGALKRALNEEARQRLSIPENERGAVQLVMMTSNTTIRATAKAGADIVGRYVSPALIQGLSVEVHASRSTRAHHKSGGIYLHSLTSNSTAAHEIMHAVEQKNAAVLEKAAAFLLRRGAGERPLPLRKLTGNGGYELHEVAFKDDWVKRLGSVYAGKIYSWFSRPPQSPRDIRATEILTMGIERLHADPLEFYLHDRDWFDFVVSTLRGL